MALFYERNKLITIKIMSETKESTYAKIAQVQQEKEELGKQ